MEALQIVTYVFLIVLLGSLTYVAWTAVGALRSARRLLDDLDETVPGLVRRAETTLESVDVEVAKVDRIVGRLEGVSDTVTDTTKVAAEVIRMPLAGILHLGEKVSSFLSGSAKAHRVSPVSGEREEVDGE